MQKEKIVITVFASDRPGVAKSLSDTVLKHNANWLESSLSHLCGQFAGIVRLEVNPDQKAALLDGLQGLSDQGISVVVAEPGATDDHELSETVELYVEANDRAGIVEEITTALANANFNLEQMETWRESASMAGYELFIAQMAVRLSGDASTDDLEAVLEDVSDDLMVSIVT